MIRPKLRLEPIHRRAIRTGHNRRIEYSNIDLLDLGVVEDLLRSSAHAGEGIELYFDEFHFDAGGGGMDVVDAGLDLRQGASEEDDCRAGAEGEGRCCLGTDAAFAWARYEDWRY